MYMALYFALLYSKAPGYRGALEAIECLVTLIDRMLLTLSVLTSISDAHPGFLLSKLLDFFSGGACWRRSFCLRIASMDCDMLQSFPGCFETLVEFPVPWRCGLSSLSCFQEAWEFVDTTKTLRLQTTGHSVLSKRAGTCLISYRSTVRTDIQTSGAKLRCSK